MSMIKLTAETARPMIMAVIIRACGKGSEALSKFVPIGGVMPSTNPMLIMNMITAISIKIMKIIDLTMFLLVINP